MYHWYLLLKGATGERDDSREGFSSRFSAGGGPNIIGKAPPGMTIPFLILGAVESLPIWLASGFGSYLEPTVPYAATNGLGLILAIAVCWALKKRVPPTAVHACANPIHPGEN